MSKVKIAGALLIGAAAGVIAGILMAPDKGSRTRRKISKQAEDMINQLNDKVEEGKSFLGDLKKKAMNVMN